MMAQVIYQYYKKELPEATILVRIDPGTLMGLELIILPSGEIRKTARQFDAGIYEELEVDEFSRGKALAFNLLLARAGE